VIANKAESRRIFEFAARFSPLFLKTRFNVSPVIAKKGKRRAACRAQSRFQK
jgi:hypothetical protein